MAKPKTEVSEPATEAASPFAVSFDIQLPTIKRAIGAEAGPMTKAIQALPPPLNGKYPSFFVPAKISDGITDATEKEKALKEAARKLGGKASGVTRRLTKADSGVNYAVRTVTENGLIGIRVFRINPSIPVATT